MSPIVAPSAAAKQAEQLKQDGNNYFQKNRFAAAIDAYTEVRELYFILFFGFWILFSSIYFLNFWMDFIGYYIVP